MQQTLKAARLFFHHKALRKALQAKPKGPQKPLLHFDDARHVGILFDATELGRRDAVLRYADQLRKQGRRVSLLGFLDTKQDATEGLAFAHYNRRHLNWAWVPQGEAVSQFLAQEMDLLLCTHIAMPPHAAYLAQLCRARLKAGLFAPGTDFLDLRVDLGSQGQDTRHLLLQLELFLKKMNPKHEPAAAV